MAIPTEYRNVMFRSRLEARWARFFDALTWPWQYEPIDLDGYIPDFILQFERPLLVEVKPALDPSFMGPAELKIDRSGWEHEALVVGANIWELHRASPLIGRIGELTDVPGEAHEWGEARLFYCNRCQSASLLAIDGSWRCRRCAVDDGKHHVSNVPHELPELWLRAGNEVQWKPPTPQKSPTLQPKAAE
jgi:hypothetical protein